MQPEQIVSHEFDGYQQNVKNQLSFENASVWWANAHKNLYI